MYCKKCGNELKINEKFCSNCGHEIFYVSSEEDLTRQIIENKNNIAKAVEIVKEYKNYDVAQARRFVDKTLKDNNVYKNDYESNLSNQYKKNSNNILISRITVLLIAIVIIFFAWKYYIQPVFFPNDLQKNGYIAEYHAKNYLGKECRENELEVKAIEENNGIYIVECQTTNSTLITLYGSKFYYGYMPYADNRTYKQYVDTNINNVYSMLEK